MKTGFYISGTGHGLLLLALLFGGVFTWEDEEPSLRVTEVSILTTEQFEALSVPRPETAAPLVSPPPRRRPDPVVQPEPAPEPEPPAPEPTPQVEPPTPEAPPEPDPVPDQAPRIAPEAAPAPDPAAEAAPERVQAPDPTPAEDTTSAPPEPVTPTAPPEATPEVRPEPPAPSSAPLTSPRPQRRPRRPDPAPQPEPDPDPAPEPDVADAIDSAVDSALADVLSEEAPAVPQGPPLTSGEQDAMRLAVASCWNLGALSTEAMATTIEVGFDMKRDGKPEAGSIRLLSHRGGSAAAAQQAFQAARRAIIRCGANGYDLPEDKYDHWREVVITFDPSSMRLR